MVFNHECIVSVYVIFQIDDGRDGGNVGFGDDDRGQYENECQHALTRIKMNYYRWAVIGRDNIRHCPLIGRSQGRGRDADSGAAPLETGGGLQEEAVEDQGEGASEAEGSGE